MDEIELQIKKSLGPEYDKSALPDVYFFDKAIEDAVKTKESGRPRFKNEVYISKTAKGARHRQWKGKASDEDKSLFSDEFEHYLKVHENLMKPRIVALPGIDEATIAEMRAVGVFTLQQLLDGEHFDEWKHLARGILDATNKERSEGREDIHSVPEKQPIRVLAGGQKPNNLPEGTYNQVQKQGEVTFNYEVAVT